MAHSTTAHGLMAAERCATLRCRLLNQWDGFIPNPSGLTAAPRVLVVDDDLETVNAMALLIKMFGHDVQFAVSGRAAIEMAKKFRPSVVILDVHLPDLEGDKVTREIKRELGSDNVRVIAISGDDSTRTSALQAGCAEFHEKPVTAGLLERLLS